jgi:hypothetical protein
MIKSYSVLVDCGNCKAKEEIFIPRGVKVPEYLDKAKCPNCGCSMEQPDFHDDVLIDENIINKILKKNKPKKAKKK